MLKESIAIVLLIGAGQAKGADGNYGTVVVYGADTAGGWSDVTVTCDGREVARIAKNRYFVLHLPPGLHEFDANKKGYPDGELRKSMSLRFGNSTTPPVKLEVDLGATYYVAISELMGASNERVESTPSSYRQSFSKQPFLDAALKGSYPNLGPVEGVNYYCYCKPIDSKHIIDPQLVLNEPMPIITEVDSSRPRKSISATDSRWSSLGLEGWEIPALAIDPKNTQTLYIVTGSKYIFKSTNGGRNWIAASTGIPRVLWTKVIAVDPQNPQIVYVGTGSGIFKSTDGGGNWIEANSGLERATYTKPNRGGRMTLMAQDIEAIALDPTNPQRLFASTPKGVYKSTDGGASWSATGNGLPEHTSVITNSALAIDPTNPQTLYAGIGSKGVFKSTNGGADWSAANNGLPSKIGNRVSIAIDPSGSQALYLGVEGLFKSTDGGANWKSASYGLPLSALALAVDPANPQIVYAGTRGGIFKTTNGGESWSKAGTGVMEGTVSAVAIEPTNPKMVYVGVGSGGVFKSANMGGN